MALGTVVAVAVLAGCGGGGNGTPANLEGADRELYNYAYDKCFIAAGDQAKGITDVNFEVVREIEKDLSVTLSQEELTVAGEACLAGFTKRRS